MEPPYSSPMWEEEGEEDMEKETIKLPVERYLEDLRDLVKKYFEPEGSSTPLVTLDEAILGAAFILSAIWYPLSKKYSNRWPELLVTFMSSVQKWLDSAEASKGDKPQDEIKGPVS